MTALTPYLKAAKRKHTDPDVIYETARENGCTPKDLARLVSDLRERHPKWKLGKCHRDRLVDELLSSGATAARIADRLGCHPRTVARRAGADAATSQVGVTDRINKRSKPDKTRGRVRSPILSFDASSGALLTSERLRAIRDALGVGR